MFEQTPPYDQLPDYSTPWSSRYPLPNFGLIMAIDPTAPKAARLLFEPEPRTLYRIQSFSPDGQRLALYSIKEGEVRLKIYDMRSGRLTTFKETPELTFYNTTVLWVSADEIVYAALPDDRQPLLSLRRYTGSRLFEAWTRTWKGKKPSFTEVTSHAGYIVFYVANPRDLNQTKEGPMAGMPEVVLSGIEALISQGYADPDRISLMGFSQGGFASLWLATQTDRFRSIVSTNGWADMGSHYLEGGIRRTFYFDYLPFNGARRTSAICGAGCLHGLINTQTSLATLEGTCCGTETK